MRARLLVMGLIGVAMVSGFTRGDTSPSGATSPVPQQVKIGEIRWYTNYDQAKALARQQHKPVWVHFGENPG